MASPVETVDRCAVPGPSAHRATGPSQSALVFAKPVSVELPDADDLPHLEMALAGHADALITGNPRHFVPVRGTHAVMILSPRDVVAPIESAET